MYLVLIGSFSSRVSSRARSWYEREGCVYARLMLQVLSRGCERSVECTCCGGIMYDWGEKLRELLQMRLRRRIIHRHSKPSISIHKQVTNVVEHKPFLQRALDVL